MTKCDPVTGVCLLPEQDGPVDCAVPTVRHGWAVHYVGDPMCSWCWGISPTVSAVEAFCAAQGIDFSITMGGLRAGGGDPFAGFGGFGGHVVLGRGRQIPQKIKYENGFWGRS